jgi:hypothetical protein
MGHIRLGSIPKTQSWRDVVAAVAGAAGGRPEIGHSPSATTPIITGEPLSDRVRVAEIARLTLAAAHAGLDRAANDAGVRRTFYLLTQIALASRSVDWQTALRAHGIELGEQDGIFDLAAKFQRAVDAHIMLTGHPSDASDFAQRAAGDALCVLGQDQATTLFGDSGESLRLAVRSLSSRDGFGRLSQTFFGQFVARFLNFYLSRITASQVGHSHVSSINEISRFNASLTLHCVQSAAIVRDFAAQWYSKTEWGPGIGETNAGGFVAVALNKLKAELEIQRNSQ